jgi:hypothetical protein
MDDFGGFYLALFVVFYIYLYDFNEVSYFLGGLEYSVFQCFLDEKRLGFAVFFDLNRMWKFVNWY